MHAIKLISSGLSREETVLQIVDSMRQVQCVSEAIVGRVHAKLTDVQSRLENFNKRISDVQSKMNELKQRKNEAITVHAVPKFPDSLSGCAVLPCLFPDRCGGAGTASVTSTDNDIFTYRLSNKRDKISVQNSVKEKKVHYNVSVEKMPARSDKSGYDRIPANVKHVSNLFVFNTTLNPYAKSDSFENPLLTKGKTRSNQQQNANESANDENLGAAPVTITNSEMNERPGLESFIYKPNFSNVPDFDVPDLLPDLPGIADLTFSGDSSSLAANIPALSIGVELPSLTAVPNVVHLSDFSQSSSVMVNNSPIPPPPPPPPPPSTLVPSLPTFTTPADSGAGAGSSIVPPPPPPPAPFYMPKTEEASSTPNANGSNKSSSDRSDLLKSIREAGGVEKFKFRSAAERQREKKLKREEENDAGISDRVNASDNTGSAGGDVMADLTRALLLRRKGISGRSGSDKTTYSTTGSKKSAGNKSSLLGTGVLAKMSGLIPSASATEQKPEKSTNEADWED